MDAKVKLAIGAMLMLILTSCASIINGNRDNIIVNTDPNGATVSVIQANTDLLNSIIESKTTPAIINLQRGNGAFRPADYLLMFHKEGYIDDSVEIHSRINGIFFGNLLIGGPIGLLTDSVTGAMWDLPNVVNFKLTPIK